METREARIKLVLDIAGAADAIPRRGRTGGGASETYAPGTVSSQAPVLPGAAATSSAGVPPPPAAASLTGAAPGTAQGNIPVVMPMNNAHHQPVWAPVPQAVNNAHHRPVWAPVPVPLPTVPQGAATGARAAVPVAVANRPGFAMGIKSIGKTVGQGAIAGANLDPGGMPGLSSQLLGLVPGGSQVATFYDILRRTTPAFAGVAEEVTGVKGVGTLATKTFTTIDRAFGAVDAIEPTFTSAMDVAATLDAMGVDAQPSQFVSLTEDVYRVNVALEGARRSRRTYLAARGGRAAASIAKTLGAHAGSAARDAVREALSAGLGMAVAR